MQRRSDIGARACAPRRAGTAMKYAVVTFGCRVNQADSLAVEAALTAAGAESVPRDRADVVLVNTCSVTASADQGARQTIRRIHRENPGARIVVTGCFASRAGAEVAALAGVSTWSCRTFDKPRLAATLLPMLALDAPADGPCGRTPGSRPDGPHRMDAARADGLRRAVQLLHHSDHPRAEPAAAPCPTSSTSFAAWSTPATRRSR